MKNIIMLLTFIIALTIQKVQAQEKIDVTYEVGEGKVYINYFLHGDPDKEYNVGTALRKSSDPSFKMVPKEVSGNIGKGKFAGRKCTMIWMIDPAEESTLNGEDFYFEVTADEIGQEGGSSWYWYVLGAAVVGGGAATYFLLNKSKDEASPPSTAQDVALPPGRP